MLQAGPPHLCFPRRAWGKGTRPTGRLRGAPCLASQLQAQRRPLLPEVLPAQRPEAEVAGGSSPIPPTPALSVTFLFLPGLPQPVFLVVRTLLSISYNPSGKGEVDSSKSLPGLDEPIHCLRHGLRELFPWLADRLSSKYCWLLGTMEPLQR